MNAKKKRQNELITEARGQFFVEGWAIGPPTGQMRPLPVDRWQTEEREVALFKWRNPFFFVLCSTYQPGTHSKSLLSFGSGAIQAHWSLVLCLKDSLESRPSQQNEVLPAIPLITRTRTTSFISHAALAASRSNTSGIGESLIYCIPSDSWKRASAFCSVGQTWGTPFNQRSWQKMPFPKSV